MSVFNISNVTTTMAYSTTARTAFINGQPLPPDDKVHTSYFCYLQYNKETQVQVNLVETSTQDQPRPCNERWPVLAVVWDLGTVYPGKSEIPFAIPFIIVFYDEVYSIK